MFGRKRYGYSAKSERRKSFLRKAFIGAAFVAQIAITGAFGYAAAGGDFEILGKAALTAGTSVVGGVFGAAAMGFSAAKAMRWHNKRHGITGEGEFAGSLLVIGGAMVAGYAAGAAAGPYMMLNSF